MAQLAPGIQDEQQLRVGGFSEPEIQQWKQDTVNQLQQGGFNNDEIAAHFGMKGIDKDSLKSIFQKNADAHAAAQPERSPSQELSTEPQGETVDEHHALIENISKYFGMAKDSVHDLIKGGTQGIQSSVAGLYLRGKTPDVPPEHASSFYNIGSQLGTVVGDLPMMAAGSVLGGAAGGALGSVAGPIGAGAGGVFGAGAGANALPEALRSHLMNAYTKGEAHSFSEWWDQASGTFLKTLKAGVVGGATMGVGSKVGQIVGGVAAPAVAKAASVGAAEIATMVSLGKGLEGQIPEPQDFMNAAIVVGALHTVGRAPELTKDAIDSTSSKLKEIYSKTGNSPAQVAELAKSDPTVAEDLMSDNHPIPKVIEEATGKAEPEVDATEGNESPETVSQEKPSKEETQTYEQKLEDVKSRLTSHIKSSTDQESALSKVSQVVSNLRNLKQAFGEKFDQAYTKSVDKLNPLKNFTKQVAEGKNVRPSQDPHKLGTVFAGLNTKFRDWVENGTFDFKTLKRNGEGLKQILKPVEGDLDGWRQYATAKRIVELASQDREHGFPITKDEAQMVVDAGKSKYEGVTQEFYGFRNRMVQYLVDSDVLSAKDAKTFMDKNTAHVPFNRYFEEQAKAMGNGSTMEPKNPIKKYEGSERPIIDPIETTIRDIHKFLKMAESNRVMKAMKSLAEESGEPEKFMERMKPPVKPIELHRDEIQNLLGQHGAGHLDPQAFEIYRSERRPLADDEIQLFNKGKREVYKVDPEVATAVRNLDYQDAGLLAKLLNGPVKSLRFGVTASPDFAASHFTRSNFIAAVQSKHFFLPGFDPIKGLVDMIRDPESYELFRQSGGSLADFGKVNKDYIENSIRELDQKTGILHTPLNVVKKVSELMHWMTVKGDEGARFAEFRKTTKGGHSLDSLIEGAYNARDLTANYSRSGSAASVRAMSLITSFWNARLQGLDKMFRSFAERPLTTLAKSALFYTLPSVYLWYANHKDPRWSDGSIPRWQKDLFWIVLTKDHIVRIPKPFEGGVLFGSSVERYLDWSKDNRPEAYKEFMKTVGRGLDPGHMPTAISPVLEHWSNKSFLTDGPIIPKDKEKLLPEDQYSDHTSETAKKLGQFVRLFTGRESSFSSPAIIENYIRAWGGHVGKYALQAADYAGAKTGLLPDSNRPAAAIEDTPFLRAFMIKNPTRMNQNIQDFYTKYEEVEKYINSDKFKMKQGDYTDAINNQYLNLGSVMRSLSNQNKFVHEIMTNKSLHPIEKSQLIEPAIKGMIHTATFGLEQYRAFDELKTRMNEGTL